MRLIVFFGGGGGGGLSLMASCKAMFLSLIKFNLMY